MLLLFQNQPSSEDKARKGKKKMSAKRKSQLQVVKEHEDECFYCGDGGQVISCKKPGCPKVYHADCLNLSKRPAGENRAMRIFKVFSLQKNKLSERVGFAFKKCDLKLR